MNDAQNLDLIAQYSAEQRALICEHFRAVLDKFLGPDPYTFICPALPTWSPAREVIEQRLEGRFTLGDWLVANGHATQREVDANPLKMRAKRIAWLEDLIREFSS